MHKTRQLNIEQCQRYVAIDDLIYCLTLKTERLQSFVKHGKDIASSKAKLNPSFF